MKRREFIASVGAAVAAGSVGARAQQPSMPVIGFLNPASPDGYTERLRGFHQGLKDEGFVEDENIRVEYRWANNQIDRVRPMADDLVRRQVVLIAATGGLSAPLAAKAATATLPILFVAPDDPIKLGLVRSLARPEANVTGVNFLGAELGTKRLELLRELVPTATRVALLANPTAAAANETTLRELPAAATSLGLQIQVFKAASAREIDAAYADLVRERHDALFIVPDPIFNGRRVQLVHLASRHALPAIYWQREFAEIGGLISYGSSIGDAFRQVGAYAGRIVKGAKPADLPVVQSTKFELVINAQAARLLALAVPPSLLARADEVIE